MPPTAPIPSFPTAEDPPGWFALADELDRRLVAVAAGTTTPIAGGAVYRSQRLPRLRHLNIVALTAPLAPEVTAESLIALAEQALQGCPGRSLRITDEASAERVAPGLDAAGWERRRTVSDGAPRRRRSRAARPRPDASVRCPSPSTRR